MIDDAPRLRMAVCSMALVAALQSATALAQGSAASAEPQAWTTAEDHADMLRQLGIRALRPGPSGDESAPNQFGRMNESFSTAEVENDLRELTARVAVAYPSPNGQLHRYVTAPVPRVSLTESAADRPCCSPESATRFARSIPSCRSWRSRLCSSTATAALPSV